LDKIENINEKSYIDHGNFNISEQELNGICDAVGGLGGVDDDDSSENAENLGISAFFMPRKA